MKNDTLAQEEEKFKYSKMLSSLFCSGSTIVLATLSLLNNLTLDLYSAYKLLEIVIPAALCFWIIGFSIGKILDGLNKKIVQETKKEEVRAYEIPSMFLQDSEDFGIDLFGSDLKQDTEENEIQL